MNPESLKPYGISLLAYYKGKQDAALNTIRDDGFISTLPASGFYRGAQDFEIERIALEMAYGHILDVGAGTGIHTLFLQEKGFTVCAIDISPEAIQIMRERGIENIRQADIMSYSGNKYDTIMMMGHGIGTVENLRGLDRFLNRVDTLLKPGGQVLLTSLDVRVTSDPVHLAYQKRNTETGHYFGEVRMQFEYAGIIGPLLSWLQVDSETLKQHASTFGYRCEVISEQGDGNYLARLSFEKVSSDNLKIHLKR